MSALSSNGWTTPNHFPDLRGSSLIGIDLETNDPSLESKGPGSIRGEGHVAGIAIATEGFRAYYPIGHECGENLPRDNVVRYLRDQLSGQEPKVGANIGYDLEWLHSLGVRVGGPKNDVQIAGALLDENADSLTLESLGLSLLGEGKDEGLLRFEASKRGWNTDKQVKANLWRLDPKFVGPYGEQDADLARRVLLTQIPLLKEEGLERVFDLETRLVDVLLSMRIRGIPISYDKAEQAITRLNEEKRVAHGIVNSLAGAVVDPWSSHSIASAFDRLGIPYTRTAKGNPSFTAEWLEALNHPLAKNLVTVRKLDRSANVFIENKIVGFSHKGRLHPLFKQTKTDEGGTRSGRMASAKPNMQQVPARNPILSPIIRGIFVPDEGFSFGAFDYSQQEPRVTVHYGYVRGFKGAAEARQRYIDNPRIDYHQMVADMAREITGLDIGRKNAKTLNLGMAYGMGIHKLAANLGLSVDEARPVFDAYHKAVPYVQGLGNDAMRQAKRRGWIKTLMGRRRHFPGGEFAHKALNAAVQGSSADMIKLALVEMHDAGHQIYNTVHDEIDAPVRDKKHAKEIADIMCNCMKLEVPLVVDVEVGPSWGEVELIEV